jgi:hypothetical protein
LLQVQLYPVVFGGFLRAASGAVRLARLRDKGFAALDGVIPPACPELLDAAVQEHDLHQPLVRMGNKGRIGAAE